MKATPPRKRQAKKYLWAIEGTYEACDYWFTLWMSVRLTREDIRKEMPNCKGRHDFDSYRISKFVRAGRA